jgi:hypothetical protein
VHHLNRKRSVFLAQNLIEFINDSKGESISIIFSDEDTPPLIADFFVVALLVRLLSKCNVNTNFYVCRKKQAGKVWDRSTDVELKEYYSQQKKITENLLTNDTKTVFTKRSKFQVESMLSGKQGFVMNQPQMEAYSPYLIFLLIKYLKNVSVEDFLLRKESYEEFAPYISWGIRYSKWSKYRNSTTQSILKDFNALLSCFPNKNIMILSNKAGLKFTFQTLFNFSDPKVIQHRDVRIFPQPVDGFVQGYNYLLGSEFYFQRSGGGMLVPAVFSNTPYLCFQEHQNNFYGRKLFKAFSWSNKNQAIIVCTKYLTKVLPIRLCLKLFS